MRTTRSRSSTPATSSINYNYSNIDEDGNTFTRNNYYLLDEEETIDQVYDNLRKTNRINGRLSWTEPLGDIKKAQFLTLSYSANYNVTKANKSVYDVMRNYANVVMPVPQMTKNDVMMGLVLNPTMRKMISDTYGAYALQDGMLLSEIIDVELGDELSRVFNEDLSNDFRNQFFNQEFQIGYQKVTKAMNLNVGFSVNSAMSKSTDLINSARNIPARWAWSVAPFARIRYKFTKTRNLAFDYRLRSSQPSIAQLQPVADVSNPLNIVIGNPDLKPTFNHRINLRFSDFNQDSQRSIMAMMNFNVEQNSIISTITNDPLTGGQTTTYTNINGVWDAMAMNMLSFPFSASKAWYFNSSIFARLSQSKGYTDNELNKSTGLNLNIAPGIAYRTAYFDLELRLDRSVCLLWLHPVAKHLPEPHRHDHHRRSVLERHHQFGSRPHPSVRSAGADAQHRLPDSQLAAQYLGVAPSASLHQAHLRVGRHLSAGERRHPFALER